MPPLRRRLALTAIALVIVGCSSREDPISQPTAADAPSSAQKDRSLVVYSQNVYVGTDVDAVLSAPPEELSNRLFAALGTFMATNWPARAAVIADAIERAGADLVALNEITTLNVQGLAPYFPDLQVEFLPILQATLQARGLTYDVAGVVANTDANLQLGGPSIRLQDFDAVLVRRGVKVTNVITANYITRVPVSLGPLGDLVITRGRVQLDATAAGRSVRFVATHLEPVETSPLVQAAQANELLQALAGSPIPVIIAGDLNTDPNNLDPASPYNQFRLAGFGDAALTQGMKRPASLFTCCQSPDLLNPTPTLYKRIDHILVRSDERSGGPEAMKAKVLELIGDQAAEKTSGGLWPSDHAGIIVHFEWRAGGFFASR